MSTGIYRTLWSPYNSKRVPYNSKRVVSLIASGGVAALLTHQYTTTSKCAITQLHSYDETQSGNRDDEATEKSSDTNYMYKPKYPYPEWDSDWDDYHRRCGVDVSSADATTTNVKLPTRHILLVRHGQYEQGSSDDKNRVLTEIGQKQAKLTGQRLAAMMNVTSLNVKASKGSEATTFSGPCYIKSLHVSNMTRAKETADLIVNELNLVGHNVAITEPDALLNEGLPAPIIPHRPDVGTPQQLEQEISENHDRIEAAFQKYFYRRNPSPTMDDTSCADHEFEVIVCHGNVIRYFVMRALQLPPEAWLRLSLFNCSITYLTVQPNGYVTARMIGDTGHIPYEETTFSGSFGYNWAGPPSAAK